MKKNWLVIAMGLILFSCVQKNEEKAGKNMTFTGKDGEVKLIVLAPGHFHANLLQKSAMLQVNDSVYVYALPDDAGLKQYLSAIESFNDRADNPTSWKEIVYTGNDFADKMAVDKRGNVVILAGNNKDKTEYILRAVDAGLNVLSDKPMAINKDDFLLLEEAYNNAKKQNVLLYDMMTERYDLLNIIEKELINDSVFFGKLQTGTPAQPAVSMESVHHFYKEVSGNPLVRPAWYYDVEQQGEGIADVTTHLIDLVFWKCFPDQVIDYKQDVDNLSATHWPTDITLPEYTKSTQQSVFPDYLQKRIDRSILKVYANGTINFNLKNHAVFLKVVWNYQAPEGGGDTFMSVVRGTKAILKTRQGKEQNFIKQLYVQRPENMGETEFAENLRNSIDKLKANYPFISSSPSTDGEYLVNIPVGDRESHEAHFKYVGEKFFEFLVSRNMPEWEITNTLAKYYITTSAVDIVKE